MAAHRRQAARPRRPRRAVSWLTLTVSWVTLTLALTLTLTLTPSLTLSLTCKLGSRCLARRARCAAAATRSGCSSTRDTCTASPISRARCSASRPLPPPISTTWRGLSPHIGCACSTARICAAINWSCGRFLLSRKEPYAEPRADPVVAVGAPVGVEPVEVLSVRVGGSTGRGEARWGREETAPSPPRRYCARQPACASSAARCSGVSSMLPSCGAGASA